MNRRQCLALACGNCGTTEEVSFKGVQPGFHWTRYGRDYGIPGVAFVLCRRCRRRAAKVQARRAGNLQNA